MLTREENELLCRVGPGTPMGTMLRRYWIPAHALRGAPRARLRPQARLRLLGESLVAFRDSDRRVGVMDEHCPHRGASLVLAQRRLRHPLPCTTAGDSTWKAASSTCRRS